MPRRDFSRRLLREPRRGIEKSLDTARTSARATVIVALYRSDLTVIAEVPELPGGAADGATRQEALANADVVIDEWIDTARIR